MRSVVVVLPASMCAMSPRSSGRDKPQKKAPEGPAKRPANKKRKLPERRAMIAALRRRSRQVDRAANRGLERAHPPLLGAWHHLGRWARRGWAWTWPRLRPLLALLFRALAA